MVLVQKSIALLSRRLLRLDSTLIVIVVKRRRQFRRLWIVRINAEARNNGLSYSQFINGLNKAGVEIDRKVLSDIAIFDKDAFAKIADQSKAGLAQK